VIIGTVGAGIGTGENSGVDHTFQVDLRGVVDLLSHHLYGSPRVYVRELLQNAVDAITPGVRPIRTRPRWSASNHRRSPATAPCGCTTPASG